MRGVRVAGGGVLVIADDGATRSQMAGLFAREGCRLVCNQPIQLDELAQHVAGLTP